MHKTLKRNFQIMHGAQLWFSNVEGAVQMELIALK